MRSCRRLEGDVPGQRDRFTGSSYPRRNDAVGAVIYPEGSRGRWGPLAAELGGAEGPVAVAVGLQGRVLAGRAEVPGVVGVPVAVQVTFQLA